MEWIEAETNKPAIGTECVVINSSGEVSIARYVKFALGFRYKNGTFKVHETPEGDHEGFISKVNNWNTRVLYYIELPPSPPKVKEVEQLKKQIETLKKDLERLANGGAE